MVRIRTRIHDRFSLEFKIWYAQSDASSALQQFRMETWLFVPAALDINALTYSRDKFYSDITNYYRAITPVYHIDEIAGKPSDTADGGPVLCFNPNACSPLDYLSNAVYNIIHYPSKANLAEYEYQIKMFCAIFKSAMRERYNAIKESGANEEDVKQFTDQTRHVIGSYASLSGYLKKEKESGTAAEFADFYAFGEEFIINLAELYFYKLNNSIHSSAMLGEFLKEIGEYKATRGFGVLERGRERENSNLLYRWSVLKKYVESDLFLSTDKRKSGVLKEQVYYSIAAGLSMIFATAVAFAFQQKYGNFTMPLFVALVVSYMLKDRIKELVRSAFSSNRKLKYFDNATLLGVKETIIGRSREGFDIVPQSTVPQEIMEMRNRSIIVDVENRINSESVLFYRNLIELYSARLAATSEYHISGINEIFMVNLSSFIKKMDNPQNTYHIYGPDGIEKIAVDRVYYLNFIFQFTHNSNIVRKRYRIMMNRNGIMDMEMLGE